MNANQLWTTSATSWADFLLGIQNNASYLDTNVSHPLSAAWQGTAAHTGTGTGATSPVSPTRATRTTTPTAAHRGASFPSTTSGDPIAPNSQGLYLPPNATEAESNAS